MDLDIYKKVDRFCCELKLNKHLDVSAKDGSYVDKLDRYGRSIPLTYAQRKYRLSYVLAHNVSEKQKADEKYEISIYRWRLKQEYYKLIDDLVRKGTSREMAEEFAKHYFGADIRALKKNKISRFSMLPDYSNIKVIEKRLID
ncbi:MAG: hypothetical protein IJZ77_06205 [Bacilli bacterium]|nr:hypothetical protein [Bacilli bacterium]MBQ8424589.1 hypothetical protein [Clostridia bacterium]